MGGPICLTGTIGFAKFVYLVAVRCYGPYKQDSTSTKRGLVLG